MDDRVEGNYQSSGQWYKGNVIRVGESSQGEPLYDIEYDDDEIGAGARLLGLRAGTRRGDGIGELDAYP